MLSAKYLSTQISATEKYWSMKKGKQGKYGANNTYIGVCKYVCSYSDFNWECFTLFDLFEYYYWVDDENPWTQQDSLLHFNSFHIKNRSNIFTLTTCCCCFLIAYIDYGPERGAGGEVPPSIFLQVCAQHRLSRHKITWWAFRQLVQPSPSDMRPALRRHDQHWV